MRSVTKVWCCVACLLCVQLNAQQKVCGYLRGDSTYLAAATVIVPDADLKTESDSAGYFCLVLPGHGHYRIIVAKEGYNPQVYSLNTYSINNELQIQLKKSVYHLDEVVVYSGQQARQSETANRVDVLDSRSMRNLGALNLSDGIAKIPGVSQLTTGPGISKPVIRGLFGNRIQTVLLGLRFDNQQWQDEHGLGLSDIGVEKVEVIKGPSSLFFGSEAMGGVINIVHETGVPSGRISSDVSTRMFSNTYGYAYDAGVRGSRSGKNWGLRFGQEAHADYFDGHNKRILNSRFGSTTGRGFYGFTRKRWTSSNSYVFARGNFGFLMDAYQLFDTQDDRTARSFERPHHTVTLHLLSSQNVFRLRHSNLHVNIGSFFNDREEQEGSGGISLHMLLNSYSARVIWIKEIQNGLELFLGTQDQYQTNRNVGARTIVPDANMTEGSAFSYLKKKWKRFLAEGGIRYDLRAVNTLPTSVLNDGNPYKPGSAILPVNKSYQTVNGALGFSTMDLRYLEGKLNFSSGYRSPNLAELSSNGLHEGSLRYEVGNINMKIEQNFCADFFTEFHTKWFSIFATAYFNRFLNYIYLQRTSDDYLGFTIYQYVQKNANIQGAETGIKIHSPSKSWELRSTYSGISGMIDGGTRLPFIPAQKVNTEIQLKKKQTFVMIGYNCVFAQDQPGQFETPTGSYALLNASAGTEFEINKAELQLSLSGNNLLNEYYYDHLSRFKYFGIANMGRNISLNLKLLYN
jgi:iron complex outermembrane receptor protein